LQENGTISPGVAQAASVGLGVGAYQALYKLGLFQQSVGTAIRAFPTFSGYNVIANAFLSEMGIPANSVVRDVAGIGLALGAQRAVAKLPAPMNALAGGAARFLGTLSLINMGSGIVEDLVAPLAVEIGYDGDHDRGMRFYRLTRMSQNLLNQRNTGEVAAGAFGMLMTFSDTVRGWVDDDFKAGYWGNVNDVRREIVEQAQSMGDWLHKSIELIVFAHASVDGTNHIDSVDWNAVRRDVAALYQSEEARPVILSWYRLTRDATADLTYDSDLIDVVDQEGNVLNLSEFQNHLRRALRNFQRQGIDVFLGHDPGPLYFDLEPNDGSSKPIDLSEAGTRTIHEMGALMALVLHLEDLP
jgi:hypothetical protein